MSVVMELLLEGAEKGAEAIGEGAEIPWVGVAILGGKALKWAVDDSREKTLEFVKTRTGCNCFGLYENGWTPPTPACVEVVAKRSHGCAFLVQGSLIYHPQSGGHQSARPTARREDDPRAPQPGLSRRSHPCSLGQPGMIQRDFRPWFEELRHACRQNRWHYTA